MDRDLGPSSYSFPYSAKKHSSVRQDYNPALRRRELELELAAKKKEVDQFILGKQQCLATLLLGPLSSDPFTSPPERTTSNVGKAAMLVQSYDALMQAAIARIAELGSNIFNALEL